MAAESVRRVVLWIEHGMFVGGIVCLAWVCITWTDAAIYQIHAKAQLDHLVTLAWPRGDAGRPAVDEMDSSADPLIGQLDIPRLGLSVAVLEGEDKRTLGIAVGHLPDTALPWEEGNTALAGHRDTFFGPLEHVRVGDGVRLLTRHGEFDYRVRRVAVVGSENVWVLNPSEYVGLTLITCYPFRYLGSAPQRFVVQAERLASAEDAEGSERHKDQEIR